MKPATYQVIRMFFNDDHASEVIRNRLTLAEAQAHCRHPETSYATCTDKSIEKAYGKWFDGYRVQK